MLDRLAAQSEAGSQASLQMVTDIVRNSIAEKAGNRWSAVTKAIFAFVRMKSPLAGECGCEVCCPPRACPVVAWGVA
jgi:hypothetical protein